MSYDSTVKYYDWNEMKNIKLKAERDICFEDVLAAIDGKRVLDILKHPNAKKYPNQKQLVVEIDGYAYLVPYVEDAQKIFLKTIIPSRKATKDYLRGDAK